MWDALVIFGAKYLIAVPVLVLLYVLYKSRHKRYLLMVTALSLPVVYALARLVGLFYSHEQPFALMGFEPLVPHDIDNSFPSDHVAVAGALSMVTYLQHRGLGVFLWIVTALIGISRMLAGLHWTLDIVVSAVIAIIGVFLSELVVRFISPRIQR
ncbi:phosphatase PAP2 family protein [Candidatus Parcubacteria bacterium]|nr:phosphatase PAP2 family protein [Candidatus Parcubacteria bacterium]